MATGAEVVGPLNIGNPIEVAVLELAEMAIRLTGSRSTIVHHPLPQDDPVQRCPDITRIRELLGWEPKVDLETGLRRTVAYFAEMLAARKIVQSPAVHEAAESLSTAAAGSG